MDETLKFTKRGVFRKRWLRFCSQTSMALWDPTRHIHEHRRKDIEDYLQQIGFKGWGGVFDSRLDRLNGNYLAITVGTFFYDILAIPIESAHWEGWGLSVTPPAGDQMVHFIKRRGAFGDLVEDSSMISDPPRRMRLEEYTPFGQYLVVSRLISTDGESDGIQLFIPWYLRSRNCWVGPRPPSSDPGNPDRLGCVFEQKQYIPESEIEARDPGLLAQIKEKIARSVNYRYRDTSRLREVLTERLGAPVEIETRVKTPASVYSSLCKGVRDRSLGNIADINGVRFIVPTPNDCYHLLAILFDRGNRPDYMRDTIALPKTNGYQSLVMQKVRGSLEMQVQTPLMKRMAEEGMASNYRNNPPR